LGSNQVEKKPDVGAFPVNREVYILRLSRPWGEEINGNAGLLAEWRGQLQNVRTGAVTHFQGVDALCSILRGQLEGRPPSTQMSRKKQTGGLR